MTSNPDREFNLEENRRAREMIKNALSRLKDIDLDAEICGIDDKTHSSLQDLHEQLQAAHDNLQTQSQILGASLSATESSGTEHQPAQ